MGRRAGDRRGGARAAAGARWKRSAAAPPARDRRGRRRQLGSRMLIWERRGHARDRRLGGLLYGLFGGMGGGGEENGGLHGAIVLQQERRATCRSHVLNLLAYREGSARRGASPGSARRDLSAGTVGLSLPSCTSALARAPPSTSPRPPAGARAARRTRKHDTGLTTQLGRRNEEGSVAPEAAVFRPLRRHRRVHALGREAARRVGVEGAHHQR